MNAKQQKRLGQLLAMGIPLPIAMPLALNPEGTMTAVQEAGERVNTVLEQPDVVAKKVKRKVKSAAKRAYSKAFKEVQSKYKLKSGKWKKDGFRRAVKEAHKLAKRRMKK